MLVRLGVEYEEDRGVEVEGVPCRLPGLTTCEDSSWCCAGVCSATQPGQGSRRSEHDEEQG